MSIAATGRPSSRLGQTLSAEHIKRMSESLKGRECSDEHRIAISCGHQGVTREEWEGFREKNLYCYKFNSECREHNREKFYRECFICGKPEAENVSSNGKHQKLSVHHIDMNKNQGCDDTEWELVPVCMRHHGCLHTKLWEARIKYLLLDQVV